MNPRQAMDDLLTHLSHPVDWLLPNAVRVDARHRMGRFQPGDVAFVPQPPLLARDEVVGPPDVIVVGSPDPATRRLSDVLSGHPRVAPRHAIVATARYFSGFAIHGFGPEEVQMFHRFFPRRADEVTIHWSPDALACPWVLPLLALAAPDARIIAVLGDPVAQLRTMLARTAKGRAAHVGSSVADAVERGNYGHQLRGLLQRYPADRVLVVQWERCADDPEGELARVHRFLGLEDDDHAGRRADRLAQGIIDGPPVDPEPTARLRALYAGDLALLAAVDPDRIDLGRWPTATDG